MSRSLFPDTTVLSAFAVVNRLDLLKEHLRGRGRVVDAVEKEIRKGQERVENMVRIDIAVWFGDVVESDPDDFEDIERLRVRVFGGAGSKPTQHLGESQTIHVILTNDEFTGSEFLTDDLDAYEQAKKRGITVRTTCEVLATMVAEHDITEAEAFEMCEAMQDAGRTFHDAPATAKGFVQ